MRGHHVGLAVTLIFAEHSFIIRILSNYYQIPKIKLSQYFYNIFEPRVQHGVLSYPLQECRIFSYGYRYNFLSYILPTLSSAVARLRVTISFLKNIPPPSFSRKWDNTTPPATPKSFLSAEKYRFLAISYKRIVVLKICDFTQQKATLPHSVLLIHCP